MGITLNANGNFPPNISSIGSKGRNIAFIDLDNSYPAGGYPIDPKMFALFSVETMEAIGNLQGLVYSYNTVSQKLQVYDVSGGGLIITVDPNSAGTPSGTNGSSAVTGTADAQTWTPGAYTPSGTNSPSSLSLGSAAPQTFTGDPLTTHSHDIIQSTGEVLAVTAGTGVSAAASSTPIANVESVYVLAGGVTGPFKLVPNGVSPGTGEVSYNQVTGVFQFLIADAITSCSVQYISRAVIAVSAGTPSGTNGASPVTGTCDAQTFTGDPAILTGTNGPSAINGTADPQIFTGDPMAPHSHTAMAAGAVAMGEVTPGTDLSAIVNLEVEVTGNFG